MTEPARRAEAANVANMLVLDLLVGIRSLDLFNAVENRWQLSSVLRVGFGRLSTIHLVLALSKWQEFYRHYRAQIPKHLSGPAKAANHELDRRGVRELRNKVVGHIWDKKQQRPSLEDEVQERLARIFPPDEETFHQWIHDPDAQDRSSHLVGLTEAIRDALS